MKQTLSINGMMCAHCEAHVRKALSAIIGVNVLQVSHAQNCAVIESDAATDEAVLRQAVEDAGYTLSHVSQG